LFIIFLQHSVMMIASDDESLGQLMSTNSLEKEIVFFDKNPAGLRENYIAAISCAKQESSILSLKRSRAQDSCIYQLNDDCDRLDTPFIKTMLINSLWKDVEKSIQAPQRVVKNVQFPVVCKKQRNLTLKEQIAFIQDEKKRNGLEDFFQKMVRLKVLFREKYVERNVMLWAESCLTRDIRDLIDSASMSDDIVQYSSLKKFESNLEQLAHGQIDSQVAAYSMSIENLNTARAQYFRERQNINKALISSNKMICAIKNPSIQYIQALNAIFLKRRPNNVIGKQMNKVSSLVYENGKTHE